MMLVGIKIVQIYLLELVGFDGVDGRGVFIFDDRRGPEDEIALDGTDLKYYFMKDETKKWIFFSK